MALNLPSLPLRFAKLIVGFTHNRLSDEEHDELDRWLEESDVNVEIFEELTAGVEDKVFSADDLIIETEEWLDIWMIAGLMARQMRGVLSADEKTILDRWVSESEEHKALYERLTDKSVLQEFATWFRQWVQQSRNAGLN